ncbi:MAG: GNAT family N-acetyltransferase [Pseudomonadales bacterium]|nr:GNAT family N-acetyltransferase [Pseudomonadales bacterium]MDG1444185.1 GNAT family N-acetyltransferase [Pseudomonadales bacterium]
MTEQLDIRPATQADIPQLTDIYNHYIEHTAVTFDLEPWSVEDRMVWFQQFSNSQDDQSLHRCYVAVDAHNQILGYAGSGTFRHKAAYNASIETTIYLAPSVTGRGIGKRLYQHLITALQATAAHRAYAVISLPNDASLKLHQSLGFEEVGKMTEVGYKFDQYWDTAYLELRF